MWLKIVISRASCLADNKQSIRECLSWCESQSSHTLFSCIHSTNRYLPASRGVLGPGASSQSRDPTTYKCLLPWDTFPSTQPCPLAQRPTTDLGTYAGPPGHRAAFASGRKNCRNCPSLQADTALQRASVGVQRWLHFSPYLPTQHNTFAKCTTYTTVFSSPVCATGVA